MSAKVVLETAEQHQTWIADLAEKAKASAAAMK